METREDLLRQQMELNDKIANADAQLAEMRGGFRAGVSAALQHDAGLQAALRARAWLAHDPDVVIKRDLSDIPDGWPDGVDGDDYVAGFVTDNVASATDALFGTAIAATSPITTPSVKMLEAYLENA